MQRFPKFSTILLFLGVLFWNVGAALAGNFEISFNGSYFKRNNGVISGKQSFTTTQRLGGGFAYYFLENTGIELTYTSSRNQDTFNQQIPSIVYPVETKRMTEEGNTALSVVVELATKKSPIKPYVKVGGGYVTDKTTISGTTKSVGGETQSIYLGGETKTNSASAQAGAGIKFFFLSSTAIEMNYTLYATQLDQPAIYLHYAISGGLKFVF